MTQGFFPKLNKTTNALLTAGTLMFLFALLWTGPLRQTYATPNNFTSHSAFQESYAPMNWNHPRSSDMIRKSYTVNKENVPVFYKTLADNNNAQKIIEYPLFLGNHYNPFYYYQHFHGKKVAAGYTLAVKDKTDNMNRGVHASMFADQVLSRVDDPDRLKFRNLVNILDMAAVKNSQADFVVLHKNIFSEIFDYREGENGKDFPIIVAINRVYKKIFGSPSFEGQDLVVYKVRD